MDRWDWPQFLDDIRQLCAWSDALNDGWELNIGAGATDADEGCTYARKRQKKCVELPPIWLESGDGESDLFADSEGDIEDESNNITHPDPTRKLLLDYDFHVVFHRSYRVPALCFNTHKPDGSMLTLDEAWLLFRTQAAVPLHGVITQMDHPVLFRPFHTLHPCRTDELLGSLPESRNRVLSFLSALGPAVNLHMDLKYGQMKEINTVVK